MIKLDSVSEQTEQGLKPCPFCGGEAKLQRFTSIYFSTGHGYCVVCNTEDCQGNVEPANPYPLEEEAMEAWNRRADNEV